MQSQGLVSGGGKGPKEWIRLPEGANLEALPKLTLPARPVKKKPAEAGEKQTAAGGARASSQEPGPSAPLAAAPTGGPLSDDDAVIETLKLLAGQGKHCPLNSLVGLQMRRSFGGPGHKGRWSGFEKYSNLKACLAALEKRGFLSTGGDPPQDWVVLTLGKEKTPDKPGKAGGKGSRKDIQATKKADKCKETKAAAATEHTPQGRTRIPVAAGVASPTAVGSWSLLEDPAVLSATLLPAAPSSTSAEGSAKAFREKRGKKTADKGGKAEKGGGERGGTSPRLPAADPVAALAARLSPPGTGHGAVAWVLEEWKVPVDSRHEQGNTPLMIACQNDAKKAIHQAPHSPELPPPEQRAAGPPSPLLRPPAPHDHPPATKQAARGGSAKAVAPAAGLPPTAAAAAAALSSPSITEAFLEIASSEEPCLALQQEFLDAVGAFTAAPAYDLQLEVHRLTGALLEAHLGRGHGASAYREKKKPPRKKSKEEPAAPPPAGSRFRSARDSKPAPPEPRRHSRYSKEGKSAAGWEFDPNESVSGK